MIKPYQSHTNRHTTSLITFSDPSFGSLLLLPFLLNPSVKLQRSPLLSSPIDLLSTSTLLRNSPSVRNDTVPPILPVGGADLVLRARGGSSAGFLDGGGGVWDQDHDGGSIGGGGKHEPKHLLQATTLLRRPFHRLLLRLRPTPLCLIADFFLDWNLPICRRLSIPRLVFSFAGFDRDDYVAYFESFYQKGSRAWLVGPLYLLADSQPTAEGSKLEEEEVEECLRSLDGVAHMTDEQLDKVAHGLAESGLSSCGWSGPGWGAVLVGEVREDRQVGPTVAGVEARGGRGFVSHCGWNSMLEAISAGVAVLTWPIIAKQRLNAKMVVEEMGAG